MTVFSVADENRREKICGVYAICCRTSGKFYVGSSIDVFLRIRTHAKDLRKKKHCNRKLQYAWNKYGSSDFTWSIVEQCEELSRTARETYWIEKKNSYAAGYNIIETGELTAHAAHMNGKPRTARQRANCSERMIALNKELKGTHKYSPERREASSKRMQETHKAGKFWTPEHRANVSSRIRKYNEERRGKTVKPKLNMTSVKGNDEMTSVLLLCHGNIMRSPLAGAVMRRAGLTDLTTAGFKTVTKDGETKPVNGQKVPKKMREWALSAEGLDLTEHRSQHITEAMLRRARIILYMDSGQSSKLEALWEQFGLHKELGPIYPRMKPLAAYLITPLGKIGDPMFQRPETTEFLTICGQLVEASTRFAQDWLVSSMAAAPALATEITALGTHGLALEAQAAAEDAA